MLTQWIIALFPKKIFFLFSLTFVFLFYFKYDDPYNEKKVMKFWKNEFL